MFITCRDIILGTHKGTGTITVVFLYTYITTWSMCIYVYYSMNFDIMHDDATWHEDNAVTSAKLTTLVVIEILHSQVIRETCIILLNYYTTIVI